MPGTTQILVYLLLLIAFITLVLPALRDLFSKKKKAEEPAPAEPGSTVPLQLQAYERLVVLMERISPQSLISRVSRPGISAREMQLALIQTIKGEYDHNVSQQIYVSRPAWDAVKTVKEQLISLINQVGGTLPENAEAIDLNKKLLELLLQHESPTESALEVLNTEAKKLMR